MCSQSDSCGPQAGSTVVQSDKSAEPQATPNLMEPPQLTMNENHTFWEMYSEEAGKYDKELLENCNESFSYLLLFAALFSAINTAFIIETQKLLKPEPAEETNKLLRKLLSIAETPMVPSASVPCLADEAPKPSVVRLNALFFTSLSLDLMAAFGALVGKEMLLEYNGAGANGSPAEKGLIRQRKLDELKRHRFQILVPLLSASLQISLVLLAYGILDFIQGLSFTVVLCTCIPMIVAFIAYTTTFCISIRNPYSPFQTLWSKFIKFLFHRICRFLEAMAKGFRSKVMENKNPVSGWVSGAIQFLGGKIIRTWMERVPGAEGMGIFPKADVGSLMRIKHTFPEPIVQAACISWLFDQVSEERAQLEALSAIPYIPAESLLQFFNRPKILERCLTLYNSNLHRRSGQVMYKPDEDKTASAIIAGAAIYHVMKARDEDDSENSRILELPGDPDLFDIVENPEFNDEDNILLVTVVHCIQSQVGVDEWDIDLLLKLLRKCASSKSSDAVTNSRPFSMLLPSSQITLTSTTPNPRYPMSADRNLATISLLLDSIIYCASRCHIDDSQIPILSKYEEKFEEILEVLPQILESRHSMMLASHAAVAISAVQWYKDVYINATKWIAPTSKGHAVKGVTRRAIRKAWFSADKASELHDNVLMALKLLDDRPSPATMKFYISLLRLVEKLHIRSMSVSWKNGEDWDQWWLTNTQMIPSILRIFQRVDNDDKRDVAQTALRIIAQTLPDDWMTKDLSTEDPVPQLRYISPHDGEHGPAAVSLIAYFLDSPELQSCRTTRDAAAEVLGWMMGLYRPRDHVTLPSIITVRNGMYQRKTSIPSFMSTVMTDEAADRDLRLFLQAQLDFLLNLPLTDNGSISRVQLETLITLLTRLREFPNAYKLANLLREFWNRTSAARNQSIWPESFITIGLARYSMPVAGSMNYAMVLELVESDMLVEDEETRLLWTGTAIMSAWRLFVADSRDTRLHNIIFGVDPLLTVLACYDAASTSNTSISFSDLQSYLASALAAGKVPEHLEQRVNNARSTPFNGNWDTQILQRLEEGEGTPSV